MTNGHDSGGGMGSCNRDVREDPTKPKKRPKATRPVVNRDDKKADAVAAQVSTPSK